MHRKLLFRKSAFTQTDNHLHLTSFPSLSYFMPDLDRLFHPDYRPTQQDIIHARIRTTGINEIMVKVRDKEMLIVDVGGQRSERRKWIHCFEGVTAILFMVSLSGYDQRMLEDKVAVSSLLRSLVPPR